MLNEKEELLAYTTKPDYRTADKHTYLGRFNFDMLTKFIGLTRVLTIVARGYMFESGEANIDRARQALCAWCSVPNKKTDQPKKEGQSETDFRYLHEQFPALVDSKGNGWFYTFVQNTIKFIKDNPDKVSKYDQKKPDKLKGFASAWRKKVMQYQVPLYSSKTQGSFLIHFDDILADAFEQGALQNKDFELSPEFTEQLISATPKGVKPEVLITLYKYYMANTQIGTDWVILPVTNFDAYFGTTAFGRRCLQLLKEANIIETETGYGVSRYLLKV
ncbi:MAG: hypothetical protein E7517_04905 [Ruminococcaceae bacterium]|nr:hypothetical protein [Oscillospiraceae bacterium]